MQKKSLASQLFIVVAFSLIGLNLIGAEPTQPWGELSRTQEEETQIWIAKRVEEILLNLELVSDETTIKELHNDLRHLLFAAIGIADSDNIQEILDYFIDNLAITHIQDITHPTSGESLLDYAIHDLIAMSATAQTVYDRRANIDRMEIIRYLREKISQEESPYLISRATLIQAIESGSWTLVNFLISDTQPFFYLTANDISLLEIAVEQLLMQPEKKPKNLRQKELRYRRAQQRKEIIKLLAQKLAGLKRVSPRVILQNSMLLHDAVYMRNDKAIYTILEYGLPLLTLVVDDVTPVERASSLNFPPVSLMISRLLGERLSDAQRLLPSFNVQFPRREYVESGTDSTKDMAEEEANEYLVEQPTERIQHVQWATSVDRPAISVGNSAESAESIDTSPEQSANLYEDLIRQAGLAPENDSEELLAALRLSMNNTREDLVERPQARCLENPVIEGESAEYYEQLIRDARIALGVAPEEEPTESNSNAQDSEASEASLIYDFAEQELLFQANRTECYSPIPVRPNGTTGLYMPINMIAASRANI